MKTANGNKINNIVAAREKKTINATKKIHQRDKNTRTQLQRTQNREQRRKYCTKPQREKRITVKTPQRETNNRENCKRERGIVSETAKREDNHLQHCKE